MSNLPEIEIRPAHVWTCDECGVDNFEYAVVVEMDDEDKKDLAEQMGVEADAIQNGDWLTAPEEVQCHNCNTVYRTRDMRIPDDYDDGYDD